MLYEKFTMSGFHSGRAVQCCLPCCARETESAIDTRRRVMSEVGSLRRPLGFPKDLRTKRERSESGSEEDKGKRNRHEATYSSAPIEYMTAAGLSPTVIKDTEAEPAGSEDKAPVRILRAMSPTPLPRQRPQDGLAFQLRPIASRAVRQIAYIRDVEV